MSTMTITIDERKARMFAAKKRELDDVTSKKATAETASRTALDNYNTVKLAAISGQGDWGPVGMAHVLYMQRNQDFERLSKLFSDLTSDAQSMEKVFTSECVQAALAQVK